MSPEMAIGPKKWMFTSRLYKNNIVAIFVVEAHCVLHWSKDFRTTFAELWRLRNWLGNHVPFGACTATLTYTERPFLVTALQLIRPTFMEKSSNRPNIRLEAKLCDIDEYGLEQLAAPLIFQIKQLDFKVKPLLIFTRTKAIGDVLTNILNEGLGCLDPETSRGYLCAEHICRDKIYGDDIQDKAAILEDFKDPNGLVRILVASVALGMGVDLGTLTHVWCVGQPSTLSAWVQMLGRVGRYGEESVAYLFIAKGVRMEDAMRRYCDTCSDILDQTRPYIEIPQCLRMHVDEHFRGPNASFPDIVEQQPGSTPEEKAQSCCLVCAAYGKMLYFHDVGKYSFHFSNELF